MLQLSGVYEFIRVGNSPAALDDCEIDRLQRGLTEFKGMPHPFLKVGQKVRVQHGPFCGAEGVLIRHAAATRVVLCMDIIQQAVAVEVDLSDLKLL